MIRALLAAATCIGLSGAVWARCLVFQGAGSYTPRMKPNLLEAAKALPLPEQLELAQSLWESLVKDGYDPALTPDQAAELDRRLQDHQEKPDDVVPWETIQADLDARRGKSG